MQAKLIHIFARCKHRKDKCLKNFFAVHINLRQTTSAVNSHVNNVLSLKTKNYFRLIPQLKAERTGLSTSETMRNSIKILLYFAAYIAHQQSETTWEPNEKILPKYLKYHSLLS